MLRRLILVLLLISIVAGCKIGLPNPTEKKNGRTWIPIADTAFLIPDKTWLTGYSRNSTDGLVHSFSLHAMIPDGRPWSKEVHDLMYPKRWRGQIAEISVRETEPNSSFHKLFPNFPQSYWGGGQAKLIEEPSDLEGYGLRKLRSKGDIRTVIYEYLQDGKVKYFVYCDDEPESPGYFDPQCRMRFPYGDRLDVAIAFRRAYMADIVKVADVIMERLKEFEAAGQPRLREKRAK